MLWGFILEIMKNKSQVIRFCIVGTLNAAITYLALWLLPLLGLSTSASNKIGYVVVLVHSFIWSKLWIFKSTGTNIMKESALFVLAFIAAYMLQFFSFDTLLAIGFNKYLANLVSLFVFGATNFLMNKLLTFRTRQ